MGSKAVTESIIITLSVTFSPLLLQLFFYLLPLSRDFLSLQVQLALPMWLFVVAALSTEIAVAILRCTIIFFWCEDILNFEQGKKC